MKHRFFVISSSFIVIVLIMAVIFNFKSATTSGHEGGTAEGSVRIFEFTYITSITEIPDEFRELEIWVPIPQSNFYQEISALSINTDLLYSIQTDPEYGNKILYARVHAGENDPIRLELKFTVHRKQYSVWDAVQKDFSRSDENSLNRFLQPDVLVPIDGIIAETAQEVVKPGMSDLEKARVLYDYVVGTMKYDKSGEGWGRGDAVYACDVRKGNCTDFHSLFIGMARSVGIPARFVSGFSVPDEETEGQINGYHCWAEFYLTDYGWVPIDASEAFKFPDRKDFLFGGLDLNRVEFTTGRDISMLPTHLDQKFNYLIYPYVMVDGEEYSTVQNEFRYRNIQIVQKN